MDDRDKLAYLQDLAISHFNDENFSAALAAWKQVLGVDPGNEDAKKGIELVQRKLSVAADIARHEASVADEPPFDADSTVVFDPGHAAGFPTDAGSFDADSTVVFQGGGAPRSPSPPAPLDASGPFDPDSTMLAPPPSRPASKPASKPASAAPAAGGFDDADSTMMWNAADVTPAASPPPSRKVAQQATQEAASGFDADSTMMWTPSASGSAAGAGPEAPPPEDVTMLSMDGPEIPDEPLPPPQQRPPKPVAPPPSFTEPSDLEDFDLPSGGLEMPGLPPAPSDLGDIGFSGPSSASTPKWAATPPADAGFSFELPPPPSRGGDGRGFEIPDIPSLGPPPPLAPAPGAPLPSPPSAPPATFGEAEPEEIESLSVPTIGLAGAPDPEPVEDEEVPLTPEQAAAREARLADEYRAMYGKEGGQAPAGTEMGLPGGGVAAEEKGTNWRLIGLMAAVLAVVLGGAYGVVTVLRTSIFKPLSATTEIPTVAPPKERTPDELRSDMEEKLRTAEDKLRSGDVDGATIDLQEARSLASRLGVESPPQVTAIEGDIQFERQYQARYNQAVIAFCNEDWGAARLSFLELKKLRADDSRPDQYIGRIFYNAGVNQLQQKQPWEANWYFERVLEMQPGDAEALRLRDYSARYKPGDDLGYEYTQTADQLLYRTAGCR